MNLLLRLFNYKTNIGNKNVRNGFSENFEKVPHCF